MKIVQKVDINKIYSSDTSQVFTAKTKHILKITTDHSEAMSCNVLKDKSLTYSTKIFDVTLISYGVYGILYEKLKIVDRKELYNILHNDFDRQPDYKLNGLNQLEYQINTINKLSPLEKNRIINKYNLKNTKTSKFIDDIYNNYKEMLSKGLQVNSIDLDQIGLNRNKYYCIYDVEGNYFIPKQIKEYFLDPSPEVLLQYNLKPEFNKKSEISKNLTRLARLYYQHCINKKLL